MPGFENVLNVHPLFIHFPIALTCTALLFEVLYFTRKSDQWRLTATALIYLAALSAVVTVITGYRAADILGHDAPGHDLVHGHRDIMLWFTGILVVLAAANAFLSRPPLADKVPIWPKLGRPLLLLAAVVVLLIGADRGGQLVFRHGMGVRMEAPSEAGHHHSQTGEQVEGQEKAGETQPNHHQHDEDHEHDH